MVTGESRPAPRERSGSALARAAVAGLRLALGASLSAPAAAATIDFELVLAVDASTSVSYDEFGLQMDGLVAAFRDSRLLQAVEAAGTRGILVCLVQWSGESQQRVAVDWTRIHDSASAAAFADAIAAAPRFIAGGGTAISGAIEFGLQRIMGNGIEAPRRVIDISGDGRASDGVEPAFLRDIAVRAGVTVNGLVILSEEPDLERYYLNNVIGGPAAFVMVADDYEDFADAVMRKLIREIVGNPIAGAPFPAGELDRVNPTLAATTSANRTHAP